MPRPRRVFHIDKQTGKCVEVKDDPHAAASQAPAALTAYSKKPVTSVGMGMRSDQKEELHQHLKNAGADHGSYIDKNGSPVFTSANARKRAMRYFGVRDYDGYGGR